MSSGSAIRAAAIGALLLLGLAANAQAASHGAHHRAGHDRARHAHHHYRQPDLDLRLTGSPSVVVTGQQVTYSATVANNGRRSAGNASFLDLLPAHTTLVSASASQGSCSGNPTVLCRLGRLGPHATATVTIVVTASQSGVIVDRGWVSNQRHGHWHDRRNAVTQVRDGGPDVDLSLTGSPSTVSTGDQVVYTAAITNHGPAAAPSVAFQDIIPASTNLVSANPSQGSCSGSPTVVCNLGALNPNTAATVTITVATTRRGTVVDRAWVSTSPPGNWHHGHLVVTRVRDTRADLDLHLSGSASSATAGQQVTYTATITNHGSGTAATAAFQDQIPGTTTLVSASASQGSCSGNPTVLCDLGPLAANASATVSIVVATTQPGKIVDRGWVSASPPGGWRHGRVVVIDVTSPPQADLDLQLSGSAPVVNAGQQIVYTATIQNHGPAAAASGAFQDQLPGKVTLVSASASQGSCSGNSTIVCTLGSLSANASATVTITVTTTGSGTLVDRGWVSASPPGNWRHERVVVTSVRSVSPDLDFRLVGSPTRVSVGQQVTYTAIIGNHGTGPANGAFQDVLPGTATLVSATASVGSCTGNPTVVCMLGTLAPGATATVTITVTTTQSGPLVNRGWVSDNPPGNWQHERDVVTKVD